MLRLVTMIKCSYCQKELDRKVYCSSAHRVADFRRSKTTPVPDMKVRLEDETLQTVKLDRERLLREYPELAKFK